MSEDFGKNNIERANKLPEIGIKKTGYGKNNGSNDTLIIFGDISSFDRDDYTGLHFINMSDYNIKNDKPEPETPDSEPPQTPQPQREEKPVEHKPISRSNIKKPEVTTEKKADIAKKEEPKKKPKVTPAATPKSEPPKATKAARRKQLAVSDNNINYADLVEKFPEFKDYINRDYTASEVKDAMAEMQLYRMYGIKDDSEYTAKQKEEARKIAEADFKAAISKDSVAVDDVFAKRGTDGKLDIFSEFKGGIEHLDIEEIKKFKNRRYISKEEYVSALKATKARHSQRKAAIYNLLLRRSQFFLEHKRNIDKAQKDSWYDTDKELAEWEAGRKWADNSSELYQQAIYNRFYVTSAEKEELDILLSRNKITARQHDDIKDLKLKYMSDAEFDTLYREVSGGISPQDAVRNANFINFSVNQVNKFKAAESLRGNNLEIVMKESLAYVSERDRQNGQNFGDMLDRHGIWTNFADMIADAFGSDHSYSDITAEQNKQVSAIFQMRYTNSKEEFAAAFEKATGVPFVSQNVQRVMDLKKKYTVAQTLDAQIKAFKSSGIQTVDPKDENATREAILKFAKSCLKDAAKDQSELEKLTYEDAQKMIARMSGEKAPEILKLTPAQMLEHMKKIGDCAQQELDTIFRYRVNKFGVNNLEEFKKELDEATETAFGKNKISEMIKENDQYNGYIVQGVKMTAAIGAGLLAAPFTGGMSLVASIATASAVSTAVTASISVSEHATDANGYTMDEFKSDGIEAAITFAAGFAGGYASVGGSKVAAWGTNKALSHGLSKGMTKSIQIVSQYGTEAAADVAFDTAVVLVSTKTYSKEAFLAALCSSLAGNTVGSLTSKIRFKKLPGPELKDAERILDSFKNFPEAAEFKLAPNKKHPEMMVRTDAQGNITHRTYPDGQGNNIVETWRNGEFYGSMKLGKNGELLALNNAKGKSIRIPDTPTDISMSYKLPDGTEIQSDLIPKIIENPNGTREVITTKGNTKTTYILDKNQKVIRTVFDDGQTVTTRSNHGRFTRETITLSDGKRTVRLIDNTTGKERIKVFDKNGTLETTTLRYGIDPEHIAELNVGPTAGKQVSEPKAAKTAADTPNDTVVRNSDTPHVQERVVAREEKSKGLFGETTTTKYDAAGNKIEEIWGDSDGRTTATTKYDAAGNKIIKSGKNNDGKFVPDLLEEFRIDGSIARYDLDANGQTIDQPVIIKPEAKNIAKVTIQEDVEIPNTTNGKKYRKTELSYENSTSEQVWIDKNEAGEEFIARREIQLKDGSILIQNNIKNTTTLKRNRATTLYTSAGKVEVPADCEITIHNGGRKISVKDINGSTNVPDAPAGEIFQYKSGILSKKQNITDIETEFTKNSIIKTPKSNAETDVETTATSKPETEASGEAVSSGKPKKKEETLIDDYSYLSGKYDEKGKYYEQTIGEEQVKTFVDKFRKPIRTEVRNSKTGNIKIVDHKTGNYTVIDSNGNKLIEFDASTNTKKVFVYDEKGKLRAELLVNKDKFEDFSNRTIVENIKNLENISGRNIYNDDGTITTEIIQGGKVIERGYSYRGTDKNVSFKSDTSEPNVREVIVENKDGTMVSVRIKEAENFCKPETILSRQVENDKFYIRLDEAGTKTFISKKKAFYIENPNDPKKPIKVEPGQIVEISADGRCVKVYDSDKILDPPIQSIINNLKSVEVRTRRVPSTRTEDINAYIDKLNPAKNIDSIGTPNAGFTIKEQSYIEPSYAPKAIPDGNIPKYLVETIQTETKIKVGSDEFDVKNGSKIIRDNQGNILEINNQNGEIFKFDKNGKLLSKRYYDQGIEKLEEYGIDGKTVATTTTEKKNIELKNMPTFKDTSLYLPSILRKKLNINPEGLTLSFPAGSKVTRKDNKITKIEYEINGEKYTSTFKYHSNGKIKSATMFDVQNNAWIRQNYDKNGNPLLLSQLVVTNAKLKHHRAAIGQVSAVTSLLSKSNEVAFEEVQFELTTATEMSRTKYNEFKKPLEKVIFAKDGSIASIEKFEYAADGVTLIRARKTVTNPKTLKQIPVSDIKYNKLGKPTEITSFNKTGEITGVKKIIYYENSDAIHKEYEYAADGITVKSILYRETKKPFKRIFNDKFQIIQQIQLREDESIESIEEFDPQTQKRIKLTEYSSDGEITKISLF